ncbi:hypothetical protein F0P96_04405 [Hymenobacter busanensis]|uniref:Uncharacterized protein n=1 Tax=Hymenobacter busanensis TaxID=2607656 RepID=A0A7L4ZVZ3_9BACT|nr:hypothetical protein [Hymenobacter busanensis]KAA9339864.1 hypothetical protein F0P96_04405 [Hymenobacter busanensis]QHJ06382.1 hypothetical protein GUY19_03335 [Hymenobacter busanensis]
MANGLFTGLITQVKEPRPLPASSFTIPPVVKEWVKTGVQGAINGTQDALQEKYMQTESGKRAVNAGAWAWLENKWYVFAGLGALITGLIVALVVKRK